YLNNGVSRVILGTKAIEDPGFLKQALDTYQERIAVGMDCKDGYVCGSGWLEQSDVYYLDFVKTIDQMGAKTVIFTDIRTDGTLQGPNLDMLERIMKETGIRVIASGGIRDLDHIRALKELNVYGAIAGKAIYSKTLDLKEAIALCKEE
ncbi:MAG: 1-(5-phosphoribosyl)-5-((5-phosphoribosylamino)methylideneamino)imidazole-4-carboxamide isomerase, partial [Erysipelotrichaceae bacterium]|nr:1-(5-phosphoribosyl)-5-((5-phosphoribosylamino)methylideneamino)imidazole-4-carboxamide isomerase [Erysipelotrichaceae bacterium]